jgi:hypothetical protein
MINLGIKGRFPFDLHRGCVIKGRIYTDNVLVGIIVKDGGQIKAVYFA